MVELDDSKRIVDFIELVNEAYKTQIFVFQDVTTKERLLSYGGTGYARIIRDLIPVMKIKGLSEENIEVLLVDNPKRILTLTKPTG